MFNGKDPSQPPPLSSGPTDIQPEDASGLKSSDQAPSPVAVEETVDQDGEQTTLRDDPLDRTTLLRKFSTGSTRSRRWQGIIDLLIMVVALLPTAILRLIRTAMGLLGITEHRWRGISMVVPLTPEDRLQLEVFARELVAGRLGRRPEPPERGPPPPAQQIMLDVHAILAAATSTASAYGLPYVGLPEAALQARLSTFIRSAAAGDTVCTQDCYKVMRKMGRRTLKELCASAPAAPAPSPKRRRFGSLSESPSTTQMMSKPKPGAVSKAYMAACLLQQSRGHANTLASLVAHLPAEAADLVETISLISLDPGTEYLRLVGGERFAEQLEAAAEFGRLRPSDAKNDPAVQGMTINARVHSVGLLRRGPGLAAGHAGLHGGAELGTVMEEDEGRGSKVPRAVAEAMEDGCDSRDAVVPLPGSSCGDGDSDEEEDRLSGSRRGNGGRRRSYAGAVAEVHSNLEEEEEGLLQHERPSHQASGSQDPLLPGAAPASAAATPAGSRRSLAGLSKRAMPGATHITAAAASTGVELQQGAAVASSGSASATLAAGPSALSMALAPEEPLPRGYPACALDAFQPLYGVPRSGAFAVHGRHPRGVGLSRLASSYALCHSLALPEQTALLSGLGFPSPDALREEVELRRCLVVAQALPVIVASLRLQCAQPACLAAAARSGSFCHVQQALLSDTHRHERAYLEDTQGALEALGERLSVVFVEPGSERALPLSVSASGAITLRLPADCLDGAALAAAGLEARAFMDGVFGLQPLLFNAGINSLQSLGFITWGERELPADAINRHSLERLNEWAARAGSSSGPALAALNEHFGPRGRREPKDTELFGLVRRVCAEVGAGRAVNCKSGKDRTALEVAKAFAEEVAGRGLLPGGGGGGEVGAGSSRRNLEWRLLRGLSYSVTSQNHGQPPAYAFNEMEIATLPPGWRPDWRLCGKVAS